MTKWLVFSLVWSFTGDGKFKIRNELGEFIRSATTITLPPANTDIIDYEVSVYMYFYIFASLTERSMNHYHVSH